MIIQEWHSIIGTNDLGIKFFSNRELGSKENTKILDAVDKGLVYLPLHFRDGKKVIYMLDTIMDQLVVLDISNFSLHTLLLPTWILGPFWNKNCPETTNPFCTETTTIFLKFFLHEASDRMKRLSRHITLRTKLLTTLPQPPRALTHKLMDKPRK